MDIQSRSHGLELLMDQAHCSQGVHLDLRWDFSFYLVG